MRRVRMVVGLAVAVCAFGAFTASAFAKGKGGPPAVFGKFVASKTGIVKGHGEVSALHIGPYTFTGPETGPGEFGPLCNELKSRGMVTEGASETFYQTLRFNNCIAYRHIDKSPIKELVKIHFELGLEFHSNHSVVAGEGEESEVRVRPGSVVIFKGARSFCEVEIPEQTIPIKAAKDPEAEYEAATYETEEESLEGQKGKELKFGPNRDRLFIGMEFKKIKSNVKVTPKCDYSKAGAGEGEEGKYNSETGDVEFPDGSLEAELEEITLRGGNISFVPAI